MLFGHSYYQNPCGLSSLNHQQLMMPHYFHPLAFLAVTVLFAILLIGLLLIVDRTRFTPVVRARNFTPNYVLEQFVMAAIRHYSEMNVN